MRTLTFVAASPGGLRSEARLACVGDAGEKGLVGIVIRFGGWSTLACWGES